ncbi:oleoyl phosphatidylcholine desaturase [Trametes versicolor FP-101664 SS1]|uniref:oleoyl phosphatidylcholine desaturase n=1 Tax=Trametes versicolor (strain FP-101664) TaxID=717944 RepID=UPI00046220E8|nr:oleoyl phosphatidylcholine desaturase [Trametes versicolor FP-101664 SS1]EIW59149.1 oleoyl phosphatidylcholine desaturase [Trametes versicolor FP-101664 SS1]
MSTKATSARTTVEQKPVVIPDFSVKDLLSVIPAHCNERSTFRSMSYVVMDFAIIGAVYKGTYFLDALLRPEHIALPYAILYPAARFALWSLYTFIVGLFCTGLWVLAHECGHGAFSDSKAINNAVGWVLHSGLGMPYHAWRISHGKHHASTGHMTQDQVYVPRTRSELGLPAFDPTKEDLAGSSVAEEVKKELWEALGDTPLGIMYFFFRFLIAGFPAYLLANAAGQRRYPKGTNHFNPSSIIFRPDQRGQIIISNVGIMLWAAAIIISAAQFGVLEVFRVYFMPFLWTNHWIILITFLQHTDPLLPHYHAAEFTFPRGALSTMDRNLLGDLGSVMGWLGAFATHGISETHVAHHLSSKIPHYHAWEATDALRALLGKNGIHLQGRPGGWAEMYRVFKECKFVEDEGDILFYKNAHGLAASRPVFADAAGSDSGIEIVDKDE